MRSRVAWWVGLVAHVLVLPWYAASGLLAPAWAVVALLAVWAALFALGLWLRRHRPLWMLLVPVLDVVVWFTTITLGGSLGGWTA